MNIAFIDIDGVIANAELRFQKAEAAKQAFLADPQARTNALISGSSATKEATNVYWQTVFDPANVPLDTLIDGAYDALVKLWHDDYELWFISSRPEAMRKATVTWLSVQFPAYWFGTRLILKPVAFQYTKTVIWKSGTIHQVAATLEIDEMLVIDDEQANLDEIQKYSGPYTLKCYTNLALEASPAPEPDDNPF